MVRRASPDDKPVEDWAAATERFMLNDRVAHLKLNRLITGFLASRGAFDFRDEWPDIVNEVLGALVKAVREGRIREPGAIVGWLRTTTDNKYSDRLRRHVSHREDHTIELDELQHVAGDAHNVDRLDAVLSLRRRLERFPEPKRSVIIAVKGEGKPYQQVAEELGVPLGTVKHYVRDAMNELRRVYNVPQQDD